MNKRRLLKLAALLEADARRKNGVKFDLQTVGSVPDRAKNGVVKMNCGTQACAMGLAAISGAFKRAGLGYHFDDDILGSRYICTAMFGQYCPYDQAAVRLFDIQPHEAIFLFSANSYPKTRLKGAAAERFVAKRIRDLVSGKVAAPL